MLESVVKMISYFMGTCKKTFRTRSTGSPSACIVIGNVHRHSDQVGGHRPRPKFATSSGVRLLHMPQRVKRLKNRPSRGRRAQ